jgi:(1->4)-alpha-D-glucan 1-alpha-D-glucosylmutase
MHALSGVANRRHDLNPPIPTATYRLQFHKGFTFRDAKALVPYLDSLGISHVYASPYFRASPGSTHGYDICDPNALNPEVGTQADFDAFVAELQRHGLRQILDFVPNHMGIAEASNTWWMDVLENGPSSPYARFFDIDWCPIKRELENKVLLPILGDQYGRVLEKGELKLQFAGGAFFFDYYDRKLPLAPRTTRPLLEAAKQRLNLANKEIPAELESILVALENLPGRTETDPDHIVERAREKEVIKGRLARLCAENRDVEAALSGAVEEIQRCDSNQGFETYDALISAQPYRLAYWRVAAEEINYRRFFDINHLAAIRMELPEVFDETHRLVFDLLESGAVAGLRIDHVDGLYDPRGYLAKLQERYGRLRGGPSQEKPLFLIVEKILGSGERLPADWPVHGTTGYEVGAQLASVLVDQASEKAFTDTYAKFLQDRLDYPRIVYQSKLLVMYASMSSEVNVLGRMLNRISETNRWYRDFTLNLLTTVLREVIACFPVYRTYLTPEGQVTEEDVRVINRAISAARRRNPALDRTAFDFLGKVLIPPRDDPHPVEESARLQFVMKFQQCTGPIAAKGVEDTAFYRYNRLVALNEVGGQPDVFGMSVENFHRQNRERLAAFPHSLVETSTHDTKRSEDVRARLVALSEMPRQWERALRRWHRSNRECLQTIDDEHAPDANEEYLLYQTLLGAWPLFPMTPGEQESYIQRVQAYMLKALHEAKVNSSWTEPNAAWDGAVEAFARKILAPSKGNRFLSDFKALADRIAELGMVNSLAQTVLKLTIPGVPDTYQGQELWDLSLVDPDNRRPVDYETRAHHLGALLEQKPPVEDLLEHWRDGRVKLFVTQTLLHFRHENPGLFSDGAYTAVKVEGKLADCCIAFLREREGRALLVIVPRLSSRVGSPPIGDCWRQTRLMSERLAGVEEGVDLFTGNRLPGGSLVYLREALRRFPLGAYTFNLSQRRDSSSQPLS